MDKKAVILLSGGLDSATVAAIAHNEGYELFAISFFYDQNHEIELNYAKKIAKHYNIKKHIIIDIPADIFSSSSLTKINKNKIPINRKIENIEKKNNIPTTYVPARNILFLSYALAYAESIGANEIFIGVNALDYSGYPDCRPEFINAYQAMANLGTKMGLSDSKIIIKTPLINMKKSQIIKKGISLGVDYSLTHSCYNPDINGVSCGVCDSCLLRKKGFKEAGLQDPIKYSEI